MSQLYVASLVPILALAIYLFWSASLRGSGARALALYCAAVTLWCGALLLVADPRTAAFAQRLVVVGSFMVATFLHVAYRVIEVKDLRLVWLAYAVAALITGLSAYFPGQIYDPSSLRAGPYFWPTMAFAIVANIFPTFTLYRAWRDAAPERRGVLGRLVIAGLLSALGGLSNTLLLSHGRALPFGLYLVLASLLVLAGVVRQHESRASQSLLERSFLYAGLGALWTAAVTGLALWIFGEAGPLRAWALGLAVGAAALALAPLEQFLLDRLGRRLDRRTSSASRVAEALILEREKREHADRLAEVGTLVSAVAHEIRNPLGVLGAHLALLERRGAEAEPIQAMKAEIARASHFVDDLLRFGRPRPLGLRLVDLGAVADLAWSSAIANLGPEPKVELRRRVAPGLPLVEADQAQLLQVLVIILENAVLAAREGQGAPIVQLSANPDGDRVEVAIEDSGPGIPPEIAGRLFQPFSSGRPRGEGNGLGLATARGILERHGGSIRAARGSLGGARLVFVLGQRASIAPANHATGGHGS